MTKIKSRKQASPRRAVAPRRSVKTRRASRPGTSRFSLPTAPESKAVGDEAVSMSARIVEDDSEDEAGAYGDSGGEVG